MAPKITTKPGKHNKYGIDRIIFINGEQWTMEDLINVAGEFLDNEEWTHPQNIPRDPPFRGWRYLIDAMIDRAKKMPMEEIKVKYKIPEKETSQLEKFYQG